MGVYEFELKNVISPKCVELKLADNSEYRDKFLAPVSALRLLSVREVSSQMEGQAPLVFARYLVVEMPDWKARKEGLTEADQFPQSSADKGVQFLLSGGHNPLNKRSNVKVVARKINAPLSEYLETMHAVSAAN